MSVSPPGGELQRLLEGSDALGVRLAPDQCNKLLRYLDLIYVWNRAAGLTTIPRENAVRLHLLDSLAALASVDCGPCLDLGTGAGLPGMVLAIASPATQFVLVESNRKKCSFLLEVVRVLGVPNARVVQADVASLPHESPYSVVISRAFRPPGEFLSTAAPLAAPGGRIVLLMADPSQQDIEGLAAGCGLPIDSVRRLRLPMGEEPRTIVTFRRV